MTDPIRKPEDGDEGCGRTYLYRCDGSEEVRKTAEAGERTATARLLDSETAWLEEVAKHHPRHEPPFDPLNCVWCQRLKDYHEAKAR